jgi:hypothetical protein
MSKPFLVLDSHFMFDALKNYASYEANELSLGELHTFFESYIVCPEFETELKETIASHFDYFIENELDDYRADMAAGTKADDAYEKHRQKQIDEGE